LIRPAAILATLLAGLPTATWADPPALALPLACTLGQDCFIQQYVDRDPGLAAMDHACGPLTYDTHKGTDIRLVHRNQIKGIGVPVLAAAKGTVTAVRDHTPDIAQGDAGAPNVDGRECGNGVLLDHGDGWKTMYCHMRKGSIAVVPGLRVKQGDTLGLVGLSGQTEFPHVHIKVTNNDAIIDPFQPRGSSCTDGAQPQLWSPPLPYTPGGLLSAGFAGSNLDLPAIRQSGDHARDITATSPALAVWGFFYGLRQHDIIRVTVRFPDGALLADQTFTLTQNQAEGYRLSGRKRRAEPWPAGLYQGVVSLTRDGREIDGKQLQLTID